MKTKIILEFGCNHNGDIKNAFEMIDAAASLGVWGIKFQKRDLDSMPEHLKLLPRDEENSFGKNYFDHRAALEFTVEQLEQLREYAEKKGLQPIISVFDIESIGDAFKSGFSDIKIPSQLYSNWEMNDTLLLTKGGTENINKLYRSTGMHDTIEIIGWPFFNGVSKEFFEASNWAIQSDRLPELSREKMFFDVTFYCRSVYPCSVEQVRFEIMLQIKNALKVGAFGYSSHEKEGKAVAMAVTLGAQYIERHFTLDKKMKGVDHNTVSSDIKEIAQIMDEVIQAEKTINLPELCKEEEAIRKVYRNFY
jgi:sialic acid synthase